jgi:putative acetyltransferase
VSVTVVRAEAAHELRDLGSLLLAYAEEHGWASERYHLDEIASLPGEYASPAGAALVAYNGAVPVGCLVMRPAVIWVPGAAELRRLYVVPGARGRGIARSLVETAEGAARQAGYGSLVLVSLREMKAAQTLYASRGFQFVKPYRRSDADDVVFMAKEIAD